MKNKCNEVDKNDLKMCYCIIAVFIIIGQKIDSTSVSVACLRKQNQNLHMCI